MQTLPLHCIEINNANGNINKHLTSANCCESLADTVVGDDESGFIPKNVSTVARTVALVA
jgi:hypothetical protein